MEPLQQPPYLGKLCPAGHDHEATGKSLRYARGNCIECVRMVNRRHQLHAKYGITLEDYDRMLAAQHGACAICATTEPGRGNVNFHVDHDHITGEVRGLLCTRCNTLLGIVNDTDATLLAAIAYLKDHR